MEGKEKTKKERSSGFSINILANKFSLLRRGQGIINGLNYKKVFLTNQRDGGGGGEEEFIQKKRRREKKEEGR